MSSWFSLVRCYDLPIGRMMLTYLITLTMVSAGSSSDDACKGCFNSCPRGKCDEFGCKPGNFGSLCNKPCPINCAYGQKTSVCNITTGHCLSGCATGYHGLTCTEKCPDGCTSSICTQHEGICVQGCVEHQFGPMCQRKCGDSCNMQQCDRNGLCHSCKNGYWGLRCENECNKNCLDGECVMNKEGRPLCSKGCMDDWTGTYCDVVNMQNDGLTRSSRFRREANESCYELQNNKCLCCQKGLNEQCEPCPQCDPIYDPKTGKCSRLCNRGFYGIDTLCNKSCSKKCVKQQNSSLCDSTSGHCNDCPRGSYGDRCKGQCSSRCLNGTCTMKLGKCNYCNYTTYGDFCDKDCDGRCEYKSCNRWNGSCSDGCNAGWYGFYCNNTCSKMCVDSVCSYTIYGRQVCTFGCKDGHWGKYCTYICEMNCTRCDRGNGSCIVRSFSHSGSQRPGTAEHRQEDSSRTSLEIGLISFVAVLAVAILVLIGLLCKNKICRKRQQEMNTSDATEPLRTTVLQETEQQ